MEQQTDFQEQYDNFIKTVSTSQQVYALQSSQGYATSRTNEYEDEEGESLELICFWSDKALAAACAVNAWKSYKPVAIPLGEFMERWCVGMYEEDIIAGADFNGEFKGYEAEPLVLVNQLIAELKAIKSPIKFVNYTSLDDFSTCLKEALE
jgi:Protein of unknown function (DUF2750)